MIAWACLTPQEPSLSNEIDTRTIYGTRRGAMVNALVAQAEFPVLSCFGDDLIESVFESALRMGQVGRLVRVSITESPE